jgi:hypothetical protein
MVLQRGGGLFIWMRYLSLTKAHHSLNSSRIQSSKHQHQHWLIRLSSVHLHFRVVASEVGLLLPISFSATIGHSYIISFWYYINGVRPIFCMPISADEYFSPKCIDEINKSKVLWLFTTFQFQFFVWLHIICLFRTFLHKFLISIQLAPSKSILCQIY